MQQQIALLHFSAPPVVGGVESVMNHHAQLMAAHGHTVRFIAGRGAPISNDRIQFFHLPLADSRHADVLAAKANLDQGKVPANFDQLVAAIVAQLEQALDGIDIIIAHNVCSLHKNLALTAALRQTCQAADAPRLIIWHHDLAWTTPRYRAELHDGWPWDLIGQDWPDVQPVHVAVSELRHRELAGLFNLPQEIIHVVPSGLTLSHFLKFEIQTAELVQRLNLQQAAPLLLLPVRITRRKNIELAIRTTAALRETFPQTALVVTGPPGPHNPSNHEYFSQLKSLRSELGLDPAASTTGPKVHFLAEVVEAFLPDVVIGDLYRLADALLFPSREEGFGIPMLEAGLAGLPVFCAHISSLREIGGNLVNYFSPDIAPADLAIQISNQLQNDDIYQFRHHIRHSYSWENIFTNQIAPLLITKRRETKK
jgi:glycosyltransferase involved in cell wall biosynthesis